MTAALVEGNSIRAAVRMTGVAGETLGTSPAVAAGVADHVWTLGELIALLEAAEATPIRRGSYKVKRRDFRLTHYLPLINGFLTPAEHRPDVAAASSRLERHFSGGNRCDVFSGSD